MLQKMPPSKLPDPRTFITPTPLPLPSHRGLKISSRSETQYTCAEPSRTDIAEKNYYRRCKQLTEQGYHAPNYKPYQLLGEPMILDDKHLILYSLGQIDEKVIEEAARGKQEEKQTKVKDDLGLTITSSDQPPQKKFIIRRSTKSQKSLGKEVVKGRKMVSLAKLGHGVFTMVKQEEADRKSAEEEAQKSLEEQRKCEWQPPILDSSEDEDDIDPDLSKDEALSQYMDKRVSNGSDPSVNESIPPTSTGFYASRQSHANDGRPSTVMSRRKKKKLPASIRPYTPSRTNINHSTDAEEECDMKALFRQLCALNWILESMMTEPPLAMESITKCWNIKYRDLRQNTFCKTTVQKQKKERAMESRWTLFVNNPGAGHMRHRSSRTHLSAVTQLNRQMRRLSAQTSQGVLQRVPSQQSIVTMSMTLPADQTTVKQEDDWLSSGRESQRGGVRDDFDTISQGKTEDIETRTVVSHADRTPSVASEYSGVRDSSASQSHDTRRKSNLSKSQLEEKDKQQRSSPTNHVSTWVRSTNRKLEMSQRKPSTFKPAFPSKKLVDLTDRLRNAFADVNEDNALMLHDTLAALEKKKLWRVEQKYQSINSVRNRHISEQLSLFREAAKDPEESQEEKRKKKKLEDESKWFQELVKFLPEDVMSDRQCAAMIDKLQSLGNIESRKITPQKFLNVLTGLKYWELCAPDVRAAIEFVREKVVGMSVEEFEAWYQSEVEDARRSKSAPPMS